MSSIFTGTNVYCVQESFILRMRKLELRSDLFK